jgi:hypothetical protein
MPIITADNYMDETFFHCNRISSPSSSFSLSQLFFFASIRKHTFWIAAKRKKKDTTGDRIQNLFMISRCNGERKRSDLFTRSLEVIAGCISYLEANSEIHYPILIMISRGAERRKIVMENNIVATENKTVKNGPRGKRNTHKKQSETIRKYFLIFIK